MTAWHDCHQATRSKMSARRPRLTFKISPMNGDLLDCKSIMAGLSAPVAGLIALTVCESVGSTNDVVRDQATESEVTGVTVLAEAQTQGRGRRGRAWHSPPGGNLYLSMGWEFDLPLERLSGISLALGAMLADAFAPEFRVELQLKWPNDFYFDGKKLGGILVEMLPERRGRQRLVVGVGLNVEMPRTEPDTIDKPWTDLSQVIGASINRNALAALVINHMTLGLKHYDRQGLPYWLERWRERDFLFGRPVMVDGPSPLSGNAAGVNDEGAFLIENATGQHAVAGGEVSVLAMGRVF
jgi:BirA family biotin operon repressor/biotin-[acetyl-CoA-carboxylase] ligase